MIWLAQYETRHFTFEGAGRSEASARHALALGLRRHAREYDLPEDWADGDADSFTVRRLVPGGAYRDGAALSVIPD